MSQMCDHLKEIDAAGLQDLLQLQEEPPLLIDVRQPQEYTAGHIPGALLFPLGQVEKFLLPPDQKRPVVVYCRSGKRSLVAAGILCRLGLTEVFSLKGGILDWPYEVITGSPQKLSSTEVNTVMDILLLAMQKELQARRVYTEELKHEHTMELKTLLGNLAATEESHLSSIYQTYLSWAEKHKLPQKPLETLQQELLLALEKKQQDQGISPLLNHIEDLLELAVQQEFAAYDFYRTAAEQVKDPELRGILFDLSFEERNHAASLLELMPRM